jgi:hypothetical protein
MTTRTLPSIEILAAVAADLAYAAHEAGDKANENALNNAIYDLHMGSVPVTTTGGFLVKSSSRNMVHRVSNVYGCNCEAGRSGKPCRHQALIEIIEVAHMRATVTVTRERAVAEMAELFN